MNEEGNHDSPGTLTWASPPSPFKFHKRILDPDPPDRAPRL